MNIYVVVEKESLRYIQLVRAESAVKALRMLSLHKDLVRMKSYPVRTFAELASGKLDIVA